MYDRKSDSLKLVDVAKGRSVGADYNWITNKSNSLTTMVSYRMLEIKDEKLIDQTPENSFLGRVDYRLNLWKNALTASTFYRSEEHTSELQSRPHLVCRLLLEKKKKKR